MSDANKPSKETPDQPQPKANNQSVLIGGIAGLIAAIAALVTAFGGADGIIKILRESDISKPELSPTPTTSNTVVPTPNLESPKATPKTSPNQQSEETPLSPSYNTQGNGRYVVSVIYRERNRRVAENICDILRLANYQLNRCNPDDLAEARVQHPTGTVSILYSEISEAEIQEIKSHFTSAGLRNLTFRKSLLRRDDIQIQVF
ncbi:hypothetical protein OsccyDRAFT_2158 [Leptolyngbyaceae cyanobacterium JSC-12]|nr:hypothetical protein OsccyDRAFT_2158 [Leptolyngbyaceae cyanobacterium JSC-12]